MWSGPGHAGPSLGRDRVLAIRHYRSKMYLVIADENTPLDQLASSRRARTRALPDLSLNAAQRL
jgi:hypothetical protein